MELAVFKVKPFSRWAQKAGVSDAELLRVAGVLISDRVDAVLVWQYRNDQQVADLGNGLRGGFRIVGEADNIRVFFLFGFTIRDRPCLNEKWAAGLQRLGQEWLAFTDAELIKMVGLDLAIEVGSDAQQKT